VSGRGSCDREAAVEIEVCHPLDAEADRLQKERAGAADARQGVVVGAVLEEPVLAHVDPGPGVDPAGGRDPEAPRGGLAREYERRPLVHVEDRVHELGVGEAHHAVLRRQRGERGRVLRIAEPRVGVPGGDRRRARGELGELAPVRVEREATRGPEGVLGHRIGDDRLPDAVARLVRAHAGPPVAPGRPRRRAVRPCGGAPQRCQLPNRLPGLGAGGECELHAAGGDLVAQVVHERLRRVPAQGGVDRTCRPRAEALGEEAGRVAVVVADDVNDRDRVERGEEPRPAARVLGGAARRLLHEDERLAAGGRVGGPVDGLTRADQHGEDSLWHEGSSRATRPQVKMLRTPICDLLGIEYPILLAGMGGVSMAPLVAAVSNAGGLGVMGAAALSPDDLRAEIRKTKAMTRKPFAVDLLAPLPQMIVPYLPILYEEEVEIFVAGLAVPEQHVAAMKAHGMKIMVMTGKVKHAVRAERAGADVVAAQGTEAGGHTGEIGTLALVPQVVDAVHIPVVAAGGIVDGRGVVAALALGAQGAVIGTRFIATPEATAARQYREALVRAEQDETIRTRAYSGKPLRALKNPYIAELESDPAKMRPFPEQLMISSQRNVMAYWNPEADPERTCFPAGQGVGGFREIKAAGEVLREIVAQAEAVLGSGVFARNGQ